MLEAGFLGVLGELGVIQLPLLARFTSEVIHEPCETFAPSRAPAVFNESNRAC